MSKTRVLAIGCVLAAALSACGGSGSSKPSSSGPSPSKASSGSPSASGPSRSGKTAPDALIVAKVMAAANLPDAQDNGGVAGSNAFSSQAALATADATLTVTLNSYSSAADAASGYSLFLPSGNTQPESLPGIGDKAIFDADSVTVLKGAQVLAIRARPSRAAEHQLELAKENGTMTEALIKSVDAGPRRDAISTAKTIAAKLTGAPGSIDLTYLPTGALDPCAIDVNTLAQDDIKVTSAPYFSDDAPMLECVYTFTGANPREPGTGALALSTLTAAQGAAAHPAITPAAQFASTLKAFRSQGGYAATTPAGAGAAFGSDTAGPLSIAGMKTGEADFALLSSEDPPIVIRISSFRSSYVVDRAHCYDEIVRMFNEELTAAGGSGQVRALLGNAATDAARDKLVHDVQDWCTKQEQSGKPAHGSNG